MFAEFYGGMPPGFFKEGESQIFGSHLFLKIHRPPQSLPDPRLNWENPFAFYDKDSDGLTEMA